MTDISVRCYRSTDIGAPSLSGVAGTLLNVLDACLVDGYNFITLNTVVILNNVVTCEKSSGHGFTSIGITGPVIRIEGATPAELNGDWRVTVVSSTVFTFATSGIADQTATGTITAKRAPAGWEKSFSGTNKAAYRSTNLAGTRLFLRIDDTGTTNARCVGYEAMTDVDTGTASFPTAAQVSGGGYVYKSNAASTAAKPWTLIADSRAVYLFCDAAAAMTTVAGGLFFGDIAAYKAADAYGCGIAFSSYSSYYFTLYVLNGATGYLARPINQVGTSIAFNQYSHGKTTILGNGGEQYPAVSDFGFHTWPVEVWDGTTNSRGLMPGLLNPIHAAFGAVLAAMTVNGKTLLPQCLSYSNAKAAFDITGPWRV